MFEMFKSNKKRDSKKIEKKINEINEKNEIKSKENVETEKNSEKVESIIPSAQVTLEATQQKWKQATAEEILKKINSAASQGNRYVTIYSTQISEELVNNLTSQGYKVNIYKESSSIGPYFEIKW